MKRCSLFIELGSIGEIEDRGIIDNENESEAVKTIAREVFKQLKARLRIS